MKRKKSLRMRAGIAAIAFSTLFLFAACNKSDDSVDLPVAGLMAFNLSTDAAAVNFTLSGNYITNTPLFFNNYTGTYLRIYSGSRDIQSLNYSTGTSLANTPFTFEPDEYYSVFLVGTSANYEHVLVKDDFDSLNNSNKAYIRYINAIPTTSMPSVSIGSEVVNALAPYKTVSSFVAVDPGSTTITISNGTDIDASRTITLEQRKVYTVLLIGKPGDTGDTAVQIKYIENGMIDADAGKSANANSRTAN